MTNATGDVSAQPITWGNVGGILGDAVVDGVDGLDELLRIDSDKFEVAPCFVLTLYSLSHKMLTRESCTFVFRTFAMIS